jgi:FG-GAP repeat protein
VVGAPSTDIGQVERAGMAYIFRHPGDTNPVVLRALIPESAWLGDSVTVGDFNGDGFGDVACSAPKTMVSGFAAGAVHVFFGPFDVVPPVLVIENPQPVEHGNFGQHLAVGDLNGDGLDDLVVSAIGNTNLAGLPVAGQVYVYPGPIDPASRLLVEDPQPSATDLPSPRFGMHVDARGDWLLVGANRKDWVGIKDAGMGFSTRGPLLPPLSLHPFPNPSPSDYMGFRCVVADVVGDGALDLTFVVMPNQGGPGADPRALVTWDGNAPFGPPALIRPALPRSADHFANGLVEAQITPGGRDELVVGDGTYDVPGSGNTNNTGRVVLYAYD